MTTATMRAARFDRSSRQLTVQDVAVPQPGPDEVLVRVGGAGICASDLHMIDGEFAPPLEQVTPGHEVAGTIAQAGAAVPDLWPPGQRVVLGAGRACGACRHCIMSGGDSAQCVQPAVMGQAYDGGWAEYVKVPYGVLAPAPDDVPLEQAALIPDALATPFSGLIHRGGLRPGEVVGLWGIGGLGTHAVQIARLAGAGLIIAVDPVDGARRRALELGADHALDPGSVDVRAEVMQLTDGEGLSLAVELSGSGSALNQAESCLGPYNPISGGPSPRVVVIGMSMEAVRLDEPSVLFGLQNHAVLGHDGYTPRSLTELLRLVRGGRLDLSRSVSHVVPLEDVARGVEQLRTKEDNPVRIVVKP